MYVGPPTCRSGMLASCNHSISLVAWNEWMSERVGRARRTISPPWLARNLDLLGEQLGLALELREIEHAVGRYSLDILANDVAGRLVVIENQLGASDHDHPGRLRLIPPRFAVPRT
jgi:hypothetical protein